MNPRPDRPRRPLLPLAIAGGILLLGAVALRLSDLLDWSPLPFGVAGTVLLVVGMTVKSRP